MRNLKDIKILFYPDMVREGAKIFHFCKTLGIGMTADINDLDVTDVFFNHPSPECLYPVDATLLNLSTIYKVWNLNCNNTRKSHVAEIHKDVFGYNADIGKKYKGKIVRKSDLQYKRKEIIAKRYSYAPHLHYMKYIDTLYKGRYHNMRVPFYDGAMPCVAMIKKRHPFDRKSITQVIVKRSSFWLHPEELKLVREFCKKMGLNYGELDILRDRNDRKIYIIDVNDKPGMGIMVDNKIVQSRFTEGFRQMMIR